jgi:glycosyltransferase involved in cell wall biosynthesis
VSERWIVLQEETRRRFGGDLRRASILRPLAEQTGATTAGWTKAAVAEALDRAWAGGGPIWRRGPRPRLASVEALDVDTLRDVVRRSHPTVLDVHDDPIGQLAALGVDPGEARRQELVERAVRNRDAFEWLLAPTTSFANLAALPPERTIVAPNGTDTTTITPRPMPDRPAIGFASGAAAGRGIELLVEAARIVREGQPDLQLLLWLVATGSDSQAYLDGLTAKLADEAWIEIGSAPYELMANELGRASVIVIAHPPGDYLDAALPIKLLDAMAAGRPVVVTPRTQTVRVVRDAACGLVASDGADSVAAEVSRILDHPPLGAELGANGRRAAEAEYDWRVIGDAVARRILQPPG